jgi:hypothetical protein
LRHFNFKRYKAKLAEGDRLYAGHISIAIFSFSLLPYSIRYGINEVALSLLALAFISFAIPINDKYYFRTKIHKVVVFALMLLVTLSGYINVQKYGAISDFGDTLSSLNILDYLTITFMCSICGIILHSVLTSGKKIE